MHRSVWTVYRYGQKTSITLEPEWPVTSAVGASRFHRAATDALREDGGAVERNPNHRVSVITMSGLQIRDGRQNRQVTDEAKRILTRLLHRRGLRSASAAVDDSSVVFTAYGDDWVAVSVSNSMKPEWIGNFNTAYNEIVKGYHRNKAVNDDCFHVHREYIKRLREREQKTGHPVDILEIEP